MDFSDAFSAVTPYEGAWETVAEKDEKGEEPGKSESTQEAKEKGKSQLGNTESKGVFLELFDCYFFIDDNVVYLSSFCSQ